MKPNPQLSLTLAYRQHDRRWQDNFYCYAVISRRSGGLSIGVNLNPDKACNFDCIYCQVDRKIPGPTQKVELSVLHAELAEILARCADGSIFVESPFDALPPEQRLVRDIAFSGDGEPTTCPQFTEAVEMAGQLLDAAKAGNQTTFTETKIVLITDACYLNRPAVKRGLELLDTHHGEIWAKLDAGTQEYYQLVNRPNYPLTHVMSNIIEAARARPIVIQSLFMRVHDQPVPASEIGAYCDRLNEIVQAGGQLRLIQLYTIARQTTEAYATMLNDRELDEIAKKVRERVTVPVSIYYGVAAA